MFNDTPYPSVSPASNITRKFCLLDSEMNVVVLKGYCSIGLNKTQLVMFIIIYIEYILSRQ